MAERVRVPRLYTNCANDALTLWLSPGSRPARVWRGTRGALAL